jgi:hypothetical protein
MMQVVVTGFDKAHKKKCRVKGKRKDKSVTQRSREAVPTGGLAQEQRGIS